MERRLRTQGRTRPVLRSTYRSSGSLPIRQANRCLERDIRRSSTTRITNPLKQRVCVSFNLCRRVRSLTRRWRPPNSSWRRRPFKERRCPIPSIRNVLQGLGYQVSVQGYSLIRPDGYVARCSTAMPADQMYAVAHTLACVSSAPQRKFRGSKMEERGVTESNFAFIGGSQGLGRGARGLVLEMTSALS